MEKSTLLKLLFAATGIGVIVYLISKNSDKTPQVKAVAPVPTSNEPVNTPSTPTATTIPTATVPTSGTSIPKATIPTAQLPTTQQPTASAALAAAKAANPTLDFSKKLGMVLTATRTGKEVKELQRLLGITVDGIFGTQTKSKLLLVKGVGSISLEEWYLTPDKYGI